MIPYDPDPEPGRCQRLLNVVLLVKADRIQVGRPGRCTHDAHFRLTVGCTRGARTTAGTR